MKFLRSKKFDNDIDVDSMLSNLERLSALDGTSLVDQPPRQDLVVLTQKAADRLGRKAQITLIDGSRQLVSTRIGAESPEPGSVEESLDYSYCKYVVAHDDVLTVHDAVVDPLVQNNLSTTINGLRSYLGVPIHVKGEVIGSFCVWDTEPHEWTDAELGDVQEIALEVMQQIEDSPAPGKHFKD